LAKNSNLYTVHNKVTIVRGGADYFQRIEEIADSARYSLHLQTYIFDEDETGTRVADALIRAAGRNVLVYVLLDGYASRHLSSAFVARLRAAGIRLEFFAPFLRGGNFYIGRRLHHKVIVADSSVCMVAGINISNRYNDIGDSKAWLDWAIYAEGQVADQLNDVCIRIWNRPVLRKKCVATEKLHRRQLPGEECLVRIRRNDWVFSKTQITRSYRDMFPQSRSYATIMTSYFWPPQKLLNNMARASRKGVKVTVVLTAKSDIPIAKYAERYLYPWLFRNNIAVCEYQRNILHGKLAVRDDEWMTAGSYNVNNISAYASVELNLEVKNAAIASQVNRTLGTIIAQDCIRIDETEFRSKNSAINRFMFYLSYRIVHFVFYLFTFYFVQRRENS